MSVENIVYSLEEAIDNMKDTLVLDDYLRILAKNIAKAVFVPVFYNLPIDLLAEIIDKVDFNDVENPFLLIKTFIKGASSVFGKSAIFLLSEFKLKNLPQLSTKEIIDIVSGFTECELLVNLGQLQEEEEKAVDIDWDYEIERRDEKISELQSQIDNIINVNVNKESSNSPDIVLLDEAPKESVTSHSQSSADERMIFDIKRQLFRLKEDFFRSGKKDSMIIIAKAKDINDNLNKMIFDSNSRIRNTPLIEDAYVIKENIESFLTSVINQIQH